MNFDALSLLLLHVTYGQSRVPAQPLPLVDSSKIHVDTRKFCIANPQPALYSIETTIQRI
jgi:hypothetical protein